MTVTALRFTPDQAGLLAGTISSILAREGSDADAPARAKLLSLVGRVDALRFAQSQDEFEAAFDLLATRRFTAELLRVLSDDAVVRLARRAHAAELAGHVPPMKNPRTAELADDLGERFELTAALLAERGPFQGPPAGVLEAVAAWMAAQGGLQLAGYSPVDWPDWMVGMLWNRGRRALLELAQIAGATWEEAIDRLTTPRDRRLLAEPFDQAASDEAAALLGLH